MSEKLKACPVCGANNWEEHGIDIRNIEYTCLGCGTVIPSEHINDRVMEWVNAGERLPEKSGLFWTRTDASEYTHAGSMSYFQDDLWYGQCGLITVTHWLDDRTEWK